MNFKDTEKRGNYSFKRKWIIIEKQKDKLLSFPLPKFFYTNFPNI